MRGYTRNLPALRNSADFFASHLQPWQFQLISELFEGSASTLGEN